MSKKVLIIGGGPAGCIAAHFLANKGFKDITVVEKTNRLGGTCLTYYYGRHPYNFGPRHFLTKHPHVWNYMYKYCPLKRYPGHKFLTYIEQDAQFYNFPICEDEIDLMPDKDKIREELKYVGNAESAQNFEEYWIRSVGETLYNKFIKNYSHKMWKSYNNKLITDFGYSPKGVALKKSGELKAGWSEAFTGFPLAKDGYDHYFTLATQNAKVYLNTTIEEYNILHKQVRINGVWSTWDMIINTISPEYLFDQCYGALRWVGRDFFPIPLPVKEALPEDVFFVYYAGNEPFTRLVEYCKFFEWDKESPTTLLGLEIPSMNNKLYPYPFKHDQELAQKYLDLYPQDVYSLGRNAEYRYLDMGAIIYNAFKLMEKIM
jgi:UDP-galactopyranose mutase